MPEDYREEINRHPFDRAYFEELERRMERSLQHAEQLIDRRRETIEVCAHCLEVSVCERELVDVCTVGRVVWVLSLCAACRRNAERGWLIVE